MPLSTLQAELSPRDSLVAQKTIKSVEGSWESMKKLDFDFCFSRFYENQLTAKDLDVAEPFCL